MDQLTQYLIDLKWTLDNLPLEEMNQVINLLHEARLSGRKVFILGNGGSASTASHFVCDLGKNTRQPGWPSFRVIGLSDNMPTFSAYANDEGYDSVFANQLDNLIEAGDVVIGISTSGRSPNVLKAIELANQRGATTVGFTGYEGGQLGSMVDIELRVKSDCIEQIEDVHLIFDHMITKVLREGAQQLTPAVSLKTTLNSPKPHGSV